MGRKSGSLYINPKKFGGGTQQKACMKEMTAFLNCLALNKNNDEKCLKQVEILNSCVDELKTKPKKPWGSINFHLQRLSRLK
ncbi:unnamed protein product [Spirodela intermedia]|uniref:IMS import disulfide relay-system CHCH-CHCH-like Cx9C domain-containing protein n=2 Tax=Spirodela intermedia TaxID=51605 RepID=A0A7I8IKW4_SPIIN|nr:unnamed protein product [Spirodela intermedia]CAA2618781.1 unnamed protein product [Spirodela intermedia]CAA6658500.1 unnamed protein product [Spirodela intermedia]CAA6658503.1 unnamed protein product [Spirodela intermedia]CAA7394769.1 unnamed protein product [Spirodela intermedia]